MPSRAVPGRHHERPRRGPEPTASGGAGPGEPSTGMMARGGCYGHRDPLGYRDPPWVPGPPWVPTGTGRAPAPVAVTTGPHRPSPLSPCEAQSQALALEHPQGPLSAACSHPGGWSPASAPHPVRDPCAKRGAPGVPNFPGTGGRGGGRHPPPPPLESVPRAALPLSHLYRPPWGSI